MAKLTAVKQAEDEILFTVGGEQVRIKILSLGPKNVRLLMEAAQEVRFTFVDSPKRPSKAERIAAHLKREAYLAARRAKRGDTRTRAERLRERAKAKREWEVAWKRGISVKHLRKIRAEGLPLPPLKLMAKKAIVRHRFVAEDGSTTTEAGVKSKRAAERERIAAVKVFTRAAPKVAASTMSTAKPVPVPLSRFEDQRPKPKPEPPPPPQPKVSTRVLRDRTPHPVEAPTAPVAAFGRGLPTLPALTPPALPVAPPEPPKTERITTATGAVVRRRK